MKRPLFLGALVPPDLRLFDKMVLRCGLHGSRRCLACSRKRKSQARLSLCLRNSGAQVSHMMLAGSCPAPVSQIEHRELRFGLPHHHLREVDSW